MNWVVRLREAPVTAVFLVANIAMYVAMVVASGHVVSFDRETLIRAGASVRSLDIDATPWRWLSAAFIHGGLLHIVMNMWVLAQIGILAERAIGRGLFAAVYVVAGAAGNILSSLMGPHVPVAALQLPGVAPLAFAPISVGASGAIMGLIGASVVFAWRTGQGAIARNLLTNVAFIFVVGLFANVDNYAHLGGLLVGALAGFARARWTLPVSRRTDGLLMSASAAFSLASLIIVHAYGGVR
jgi:rhomboid protease GluP